MPNDTVKFKNLPTDARSYIMMHTLSSPLMIAEYAFIAYLLYNHYLILEIGIFFTVANLMSVFGPYLIGKTTKLNINARKTMSLIFVIEGIGYFALFLASGAFSSLILLFGLIIFKFSSVFYSIFPSYEQIVFPERIRVKSYLYYLIYPEYTQIVAFPVIGFILSYVFPWAITYRILFLIMSLGSLLMLPFIRSRVRLITGPVFTLEKKMEKITLPKPFFLIFLSQTFLYAAQAIVPNLVLVYYVMVVLRQSFFVVMLLEVLNSGVTIALGSMIKRGEINSRMWLIIGVFLFIAEQIMYITAGVTYSVYLIAIGILFGTAGNVLWFPINRSTLMRYIPESARGEVFGTIASVSRGINVAMPFISAYLITLYVYSPFIISASLFVASLTGYSIITRKSKQIPQF
ncbi:MAG: hypothetical protein ACYDAO_10230 [Thermoplasmataceae archaeon]